jgi:hypothetical protein
MVSNVTMETKNMQFMVGTQGNWYSIIKEYKESRRISSFQNFLLYLKVILI